MSTAVVGAAVVLVVLEVEAVVVGSVAGAVGSVTGTVADVPASVSSSPVHAASAVTASASVSAAMHLLGRCVIGATARRWRDRRGPTLTWVFRQGGKGSAMNPGIERRLGSQAP